jgi:hypothetical protein
VPVRAIAESFNAMVDWDGNAQRVSIISGPSEDIDIPPQYNDEEAWDYITNYRIGYTMGYRQGKSDSESNAGFTPLPSPPGSGGNDPGFDTAYKQGWEDGYAGKKEALTLLDLPQTVRE